MFSYGLILLEANVVVIVGVVYIASVFVIVVAIHIALPGLAPPILSNGAYYLLH